MEDAKVLSRDQARRWLLKGGPPPAPSRELSGVIDQLLRSELSRSVKSALRLSDRFESRIRGLDDQLLNLSAARTRARTLHLGGQHRDALNLYRKARTMSLRQGETLTTARIDRALTDLYMYLNRYRDAEVASERAIQSFRQLGLNSDVAASQVNLGNVFHRQDRHRDAARMYQRAESFFATTDDELAQARVAYNLGNTLVQTFDWGQATDKYQGALEIYDRHGYTLDANDARYGLAYLNLLFDRYGEALTELSECERIYKSGGDPRGAALCTLDLSEAFLGLNLFDDALDSARHARQAFSRLKQRYEGAKAQLFAAMAHEGLGNLTEARARAQSALRDFEREKNRGMSAACRFLLGRLKSSPKQRIRELKRAREMFSKAQLPIWTIVCDLQCALEEPAARRTFRGLSRNAALRRVPHWQAMYHALRGDTAAARGRRSEARRQWRKAVDILEQVRMSLPPLELRSAYLARRTAPYHRLLAMDAGQNALAAAGYAERLKTSGPWNMEPHTGDDPELEKLITAWQDAMSQLAGMARRLYGGKSAARAQTATVAEQSMRRLERRCRLLQRKIESHSARAVHPAGDVDELLRRVSATIPAVMWQCLDQDLYAFVLRNGTCTSHFWPGGVARLNVEMRRWRFLLEKQILQGDPDSAPAADAEIVFWDELGEWLWQPLVDELRGVSSLLVVPDGPLFNLPLAAIRVGNQWLGDRLSLSVMPSLRHFEASRALVTPDNGIEIFHAGGDDLPSVQQEVETILSLVDNQHVRLHRPTQRQSLLGAKPGRLWHFAGHATFRADNPFYSALLSEDGAVFASELRRRRVPVELATLSACHSAGGSSMPGESFGGLVRALLEMGACNVVAALWPVTDKSTAFWMMHMYRAWLSGRSLNDSVRTAQQATRKKWGSPYYWAAFSLYGSDIMR